MSEKREWADGKQTVIIGGEFSELLERKGSLVAKEADDHQPDEEEKRVEEQQQAEERARQIVDRAQLEAKEIVSEAEERAEALLEEAKKRAKQQKEKTLEEARRQGYGDGYEEGLNIGRRKMKRLRKKLKDYTSRLRELKLQGEGLRRQLVLQARDDLLDLSVRIAEKILRSQIDLQPERIEDIVTDLLQKTTGAEVVVKAAPSSVLLLQQSRETLRGVLPEDCRLGFESDNSLAPGECIVRSDSGTLDARLGPQLEKFRQRLRRTIMGADPDDDGKGIG